MPQVIANTYEISKKLGHGGLGEIYLAWHKNLEKWVVVKKDTRADRAERKEQRQEVDTLKSLSHTYIPQVYDYIEEEDEDGQKTVYTVMDFIQGKDLKELLKEGSGRAFKQSLVIKWACELLEALQYLHSKGYIHADIKPSNIMLTPEGDIRLIDFNIALAMGENHAVTGTKGYASPEHSGQYYSYSDSDSGSREKKRWREQTETIVPPRHWNSTNSDNKPVSLDFRSDIYCLGATLYHLLTGHRPADRAEDVERISEDDDVSPLVAAIISKAMQPKPDDRYQSAQEMLDAFRNLYPHDPRSIRHKHRILFSIVASILIFLVGGGFIFVGMNQRERLQNAYKLAGYSADALREGKVDEAIFNALEALTDSPYTPQAQSALTNALGVYELSDNYKAFRLIDNLPGKPVRVKFSPNGDKVAALVENQIMIFETQSGESVAELPAEPSALSEFIFRDNDTLIYAAPGSLRAVDIETSNELWSTERPATGIALSGNGEIVASIYKDENSAALYSAFTGELLRIIDFGVQHQAVVANDVLADPEYDLFTLNATGQWLAVSFSDGGLRIFNRYDSGYDVEIYDVSDFQRFEGAFFDACFAFVSTREGESIFAVVDLSIMEQAGGFNSTKPFHVKTDETGVYLSLENVLVRLDPFSGEQEEVAYTGESDIVAFVHKPDLTLIQTGERKCELFNNRAKFVAEQTRETRIDFMDMAGDYILFANRDAPSIQIFKWESHDQRNVLRYDSAYTHDEARLHSDRQTAILFRTDGFQISELDETILAEVKLPNEDDVFDLQYRREGNPEYLEVIYNDGLRRNYSAKTGELLSEEYGTLPDRTLYEELPTEDYRIHSPLNGKPSVYDSDGTRLLKELNEDAYLMYATQIGNYLLTEYMTIEGERYGVLLDSQLEEVARMPGLCDNLNEETLIFDDNAGHLRESGIYTLSELIELGKEHLARSEDTHQVAVNMNAVP